MGQEWEGERGRTEGADLSDDDGNNSKVKVSWRAEGINGERTQ